MELTINKARLLDRLERLAQIGKLGDTGVCRLALSKEDRQAVGLVKSWFEEAGLAARIDKVEFTVDLRDINRERRDRLEAELMETIRRTAEEYGLEAELREDTNSPPRYCAEWIKDAMRRSAREMGLAPPELMSGPFHDALAMSYACDYGMIFVRCREGISHNPREFAAIDDIALGAELLYRTAVDIARAGSGSAAPAATESGA